MKHPDFRGLVATEERTDTKLYIEAFGDKFKLDCDHDRQGNKKFMELPRIVNTVPGAKSFATRVTGEKLIWTEVEQ